jgi:hypothetical protein
LSSGSSTPRPTSCSPLGHVHAYERTHRVSNVVNDSPSPVRTRPSTSPSVTAATPIEGVQGGQQPRPRHAGHQEQHAGHLLRLVAPQPARTAPRSSPTASGSPTDTTCQPTTLVSLALPSDRIVFVAVSYNSVGRLYPNHHIDHDNVHVTVMSQMRIHQDIYPKL